MPFKIVQASLPNHKALVLIVLGTLLAGCMTSGYTFHHPLLDTNSFGGVDIATSVKRHLRTRTYMTNGIPNNDGGRILLVKIPESVTSVFSNIKRAVSEWIERKAQAFEDSTYAMCIHDDIHQLKTSTWALKSMGLIDMFGQLRLDHPATAKYEEYVERYVKETNSPYSAIDYIYATYVRSDPKWYQLQIILLKREYAFLGRDSFGGRLYKQHLNTWRNVEPKAVAEDLEMYKKPLDAQVEVLLIWMDYLGLHLKLPTLGNGYDDARNSILRIFGETFGVGPDLLLKNGPSAYFDDSMRDWRQALQSGDNLRAYALEELVLLEL